MVTQHANPRAPHADFATAWAGIRSQVAAYCRHTMRDPVDADDLYQRVSIRAWRGHATFQGRSHYLTWVLRIAEREAARLGGSLSRTRRREEPYDDREAGASGRAETSEDPPSQPAVDASWIRAAASAAADAGAITAVEHQIVLARLERPYATWQQIAEHLATSANVCAVTHCRAVVKLRVYLCEHRPDLLGGHSALTSGYERALRSAMDPLTPAEAAAFRAVVLDRRRDYRARGWRTALRGACGKVLRQVSRN